MYELVLYFVVCYTYCGSVGRGSGVYVRVSSSGGHGS